MLYLRFTFSIPIQERLGALGKAHDELDPLSLVPDEYTGSLRRHVLAEAVHYSTFIEGNTLTLAQVKTVIRGGSVRAPRHQIQEVENYREAVAYIQSQVLGNARAITEDVIRAIHYLVSKSLPGAYGPGRYRTEQNYVIDRITRRRVFAPPAYNDVPELMGELVDWLNLQQEHPPAVRAALAHLNLVAIHPFMDGNGRTARLLASLVMYAGGVKSEDLVSVEAYLGKDHQGYYHALADALGPVYSPQTDVTVWVEYHLHAHVEQARLAVQLTAESVATIEGLGAAFEEERLSTWQLVALYIACDDGQVSNRACRSVTGRSAPSTAADLSTLIDKGLLSRTGRARSTAYVPTQRTWDIFNRIKADLGAPTQGF